MSSPENHDASSAHPISVALLTGGADKHYSLGLTGALAPLRVLIDYIGSDALVDPYFDHTPGVRFLNLRGDQNPRAPTLRKTLRVFRYYARLIGYAVTARARIFHLLWNNRFENFDRTLLILFYRFCGRRVVMTAHNVNAGKRDGNDSRLNRLTLRLQYRFVRRIFVHTPLMAADLRNEFGVPDRKIVLIPYGINNAVPVTNLDGREAKRRLGLADTHKVILFFGRIVPYKGLEFLVRALKELVGTDRSYRLVIAGSPHENETYWQSINTAIDTDSTRGHVVQHTSFIPDTEVEPFFKAADVLVMPYTHIFQSGILALSYSFGLPVIVTDVGALREHVEVGRTGLVCRPQDQPDLVAKIQEYFRSPLYRELADRRAEIQSYAAARHSWEEVGRITEATYRAVLAES